MMEIIQHLASSRLIMTPSEADFHSDATQELHHYLKGFGHWSGKDTVALFRLAWELSTSSFAGRQEQYERFFFGGPDKAIERLIERDSRKEAYRQHVLNFLRG